MMMMMMVMLVRMLMMMLTTTIIITTAAITIIVTFIIITIVLTTKPLCINASRTAEEDSGHGEYEKHRHSGECFFWTGAADHANVGVHSDDAVEDTGKEEKSRKGDDKDLDTDNQPNQVKPSAEPYT